MSATPPFEPWRDQDLCDLLREVREQADRDDAMASLPEQRLSPEDIDALARELEGRPLPRKLLNFHD